MANELAAVVEAGSTGNYGWIVNPSHAGEAWNTVTSSFAAMNTANADLRVAFNSPGIAVGPTDERQFASLPSGLDADSEWTVLVFDGTDQLIAERRYTPQYTASDAIAGVPTADENADAVAAQAGIADLLSRRTNLDASISGVPAAVRTALESNGTMLSNTAGYAETVNNILDELTAEAGSDHYFTAAALERALSAVERAKLARLPESGVVATADDAGLTTEQATQLAAASSATASLSVERVHRKRTWYVTERGSGHKASPIVTVQDGFAGTLAFDFSRLTDVILTGTPTVTLTHATASVTATSIALRASDTKAVHFDVPELTVTGTYTIKVTATSVDGQTIPVEGALSVE